VQALSEDWAQGEAGQHSIKATRLNVVAVAVSLCLHFLLLAVIQRFTVNPDSRLDIQQPTLSTVSIRLVPANPLLEDAGVQDAAAEPVEELVASEPQEMPLTESIVQAEEVLEEADLVPDATEQADQEQNLVEVTEQLELTEMELLEQATSIELPSVLSIQSSVRREQESQTASTRDWANTCTELQQVVGVLGCQQTREPDYQAATVSPQRQSIYEFHNPVAERSRSAETSPIIAAQTGALAASLALNEIPAGLSEYLMAEVEAGISLYSNQGNLALQNMDLMVERSAAAQIARGINSPWVQLATRQQQARRYLTRQDRQESKECQSALLLIFTPEEIAKCLDDGHFGVILSPLSFSFDIDY